MIKLNKWESQLVYLSKGHLGKYINDIRGVENSFSMFPDDFNLKDVLQNLWGERCGLYPEHVELYFVAEKIYDTVEKCDCFKKMGNHSPFSFIAEMMPQYKYDNREINYTDNKSYIERICKVGLKSFLSPLQIYEIDLVEKITLIDLQPFEPELFLTEEQLEELMVLDACPFCGEDEEGGLILEQDESLDDHIRFTITCHNCGAYMAHSFDVDSKEQLIKSWNRRV